MTNKRPALFLDRDGTINEDRGYICRPEQLLFIPGAIPVLKKLQEKYSLFVITNQSGIGLGYFTEQEFLKFNAFFLAQLAQAQVQITDLYYCPHMAEDKCCCRKPSTYFIDLACAKYSLDLNNSYVIGDHPSDMDLAQAAGIKSIYVLSGHGQKHRPELTFRPTFVVQDITQILPLVL